MFNNYMHSVEFSRNCIMRSLTYVDFEIHIIITKKKFVHILYCTKPLQDYRFYYTKEISVFR